MKRSLWLTLMIGLLAGLPTSAAADPLYAGTSYPGKVYQYQGGTTWEAISPWLGEAVLCLTEYEGHLYAGTTSWSTEEALHGEVYRYDGGGEWTIVADGRSYDEFSSLAVYHNRLYAATSWKGGQLYRYEGGTDWTLAVDYDGWWGIRPLWVHTDGYLYLGDCSYDSIGRYDEAGFGQAARLGGGGLCDFSAYGGALYAAAWYDRLHRSTDGLTWHTLPGYDKDDPALWILWELEQFDESLYLGGDGGELRRIDHAGTTHLVWTAPPNTSIISMLADGHDCLYLGTGQEAFFGNGLPVGEIYRYTGTGDPVLISGVLGQGVQCLFMPYTFPDIRREHWAYEEIESCCEAGIVAGYPDGHFSPTRAVSRGQMAVFIARALLGGDENVPDGPPSPTYPDVDTDYWAYKYVECISDNAIAQGYGDGNFHPEYLVSRDYMAVFMARALVDPTGEAALADYVPSDPRNFPDVPATGYGDDGTDPYWAYKHIEYCVENGVVQGYEYPDPDTPRETIYLYQPLWPVTRDQMAVFIARSICDPTGDEGLVGYIPPDPGSFPDVPTTGYGDTGADPYWAYRYIEYCVEHGVVNGYEYPDPDTPGETMYLYQPLWPVTRDQMAVYIARAFDLPT